MLSISKFFSVSIIAVMSFSGVVYADSSFNSEFALIESRVNQLHAEFDKDSTERLNGEVVSKNMNYLEEYLLQALKRSEMKLEKYKNKLREENDKTTNNDDSYYYYSSALKKAKSKVDAFETRVKVIKEILFSIQVLKLRFDM